MAKFLSILSISILLLSCGPERDKEFVSNEAYLAMFNGEFDQALQLYNELIELDKGDFQSYLNRAKVYMELGEVELAVEDIKLAKKIAPNEIEVLNIMAYISQVYGDNASARSYLDQALSNNPKYYEARKQKAILLANNSKNEDALYELNLLVEVDTADIDVLQYRAMILSKLGEFDKSIADLQGIIKLDSNNLDAYGNLGVAYMRANLIDSAEFCFKHVLSNKPSDQFSLDKLSSLYIKEMRFEEAQVILDKMLSYEGLESRAYGKIGLLNFEQSNFDLARVNFEESIKEDPLQYFAFKYLALIEKENGFDSLACEYIRTSINNGLPFEGNEDISVRFEQCLK